MIRLLRHSMLFVFAGCLLGGCVATSPHPTITNHQDRNQPNGHVQVGLHEVRDDEGTLTKSVEVLLDAEGQYVRDDNDNFVAHGLLTNYWDDGPKKSQVRYVNGVLHGPRTAWYRNGQIWSDGQHVDGREDGVWTVWFPDGRKAQEFHFDHGAWHGLYTEWHTSGKKKREIEYVWGIKQGPMTIWDEQGNVARQIDYVDDEPQP